MEFSTVLARFTDVAEQGDGGYLARCPAHGDSRPSLRIWRGDDNKVRLTCRAGCKPDEVVKAAGLIWPNLFDVTGEGNTVRKEPRQWSVLRTLLRWPISLTRLPQRCSTTPRPAPSGHGHTRLSGSALTMTSWRNLSLATPPPVRSSVTRLSRSRTTRALRFRSRTLTGTPEGYRGETCPASVPAGGSDSRTRKATGGPSTGCSGGPGVRGHHRHRGAVRRAHSGCVGL